MAGEYMTYDELYGVQEEEMPVQEEMQIIQGGITYTPEIWEILIPSGSIFYPLSTRKDKTSLFIMSLCRLILYVFILKYCYDNIGNNVLNIFIVVIIVVNCLYLLTVMIQQPLNN